MFLLKHPSINLNQPTDHLDYLSTVNLEYLENGLHVWADESWGVRHQVTQHSGALLFVSAHTAVFKLGQNLQKV